MDLPPKPTGQSENEQAAQGAAETFPAPPPEKPPHKGLFQLWFNPESRFGRFNRRLLRSLVVVVCLFGLGVGSLYFLRYLPLQRQSAQNQAALATAQASLDSLTREASTLQASSAALQTAAGMQELQVGLLRLKTQAALARAELLAHNPAGASAALESARKILAGLAPDLKRADPTLAETIQARLDLSLSEIKADPDTAASDLVILFTKLGEMENLLFPGSN